MLLLKKKEVDVGFIVDRLTVEIMFVCLPTHRHQANSPDASQWSRYSSLKTQEHNVLSTAAAAEMLFRSQLARRDQMYNVTREWLLLGYYVPVANSYTRIQIESTKPQVLKYPH
jgi:hypothetical protein